MKYEWDEETNMLKLDRVLHGAAFYPHDYGFIPQTLCGDGDPLVRVYGIPSLRARACIPVGCLMAREVARHGELMWLFVGYSEKIELKQAASNQQASSKQSGFRPRHDIIEKNPTRYVERSSLK